MATGDGEIVAENVVALVKKETTYGTSPSPGAGDGVLFRRIVAPDLELETWDQDVVTSSEVMQPHGIGKYNYSLSAEWDMRGSGTVDTVPDESPLYQAAGLVETVNASTDVTYTPNASAGASAEVALFLDDDHKFQLLGYRGSLSLSAPDVGQPVRFSQDAKALYAAPTNAASPGAESYSSQIPPAFVEGSFTFDGDAFNLRSFELDFGSIVAPRTKLGGTGGFAGWKVTGFRPSGSFVVELDSVADKNWFAAAVTGNAGAIDMTIGTTAGNRFDIDLPNVKLTAPQFSEAEGIAIATIGFQAYDSSPGSKDWIAIKHY